MARRAPHLGREDLGALVEVEREVTGEVEGPREPFPRRHHQRRPAVSRALRQVRHRPGERRRVEPLPVPDRAVLRDLRHVLPAPRRGRRAGGARRQQQRRREKSHRHGLQEPMQAAARSETQTTKQMNAQNVKNSQ